MIPSSILGSIGSGLIPEYHGAVFVPNEAGVAVLGDDDQEGIWEVAPARRQAER